MFDYRLMLLTDSEFGADATIPAGQWTKIGGYVRPQWVAAPAVIKWKARSAGHAQWFYIDDVVLREIEASDRPLAGSWRTEVE